MLSDGVWSVVRRCFNTLASLPGAWSKERKTVSSVRNQAPDSAKHDEPTADDEHALHSHSQKLSRAMRRRPFGGDEEELDLKPAPKKRYDVQSGCNINEEGTCLASYYYQRAQVQSYIWLRIGKNSRFSKCRPRLEQNADVNMTDGKSMSMDSNASLLQGRTAAFSWSDDKCFKL